MSLTVPEDELAEGPTVAADEQREAALEVLVDVSVNDTGSVPLLVIVEDAHWLDATTLEFVERMWARLQNFARHVHRDLSTRICAALGQIC